MSSHINLTEWVVDQDGDGWFNGYYDNHGRQVEGEHESGARMMLTGQVFAIMGGTADEDRIRSITRSADKYLYDRYVGGYRLNTDFHEMKTDMGRMFGFAYGEKENGAVFSHMTVMYANALYKRGFARKGYKALQTLADTAMDFETSKIYPGIPEYFNAKGRGMYHYLTGAASWYMLTVVTEVFGVRGKAGDLEIVPALMKEQFDDEGKAEMELLFAGKKFHIIMKNPQKSEYEDYRICSAAIDGREIPLTETPHGSGRRMVKAVLGKAEIASLSEGVHKIEILLDAAEGGLL